MALVLVIDDASTIRQSLRRMLASTRHTVIEAEDGQVGLALFREQHPELVITDLVMPNLDGIETIREIRRAKSATKIIAMSRHSVESGAPHLTAAKKLGADAILAKPFQGAQLIALVDQLLEAGEIATNSLSPPVANTDPILEISDPRLLRLYYYWLERKGNRRWPTRRDIDPLDFGYVLGNVMLVDVLVEPLRFHVRLHGTTLAKLAGYELTGKFLSEIPIADFRNQVIKRCEALVASGDRMVVHQDRILDGRSHAYEALWLPFSDNGSDVTMLLCAVIYDCAQAGERTTAPAGPLRPS